MLNLINQVLNSLNASLKNGQVMLEMEGRGDFKTHKKVVRESIIIGHLEK